VSPDGNCELDYLAGLLELMSDDADRARTAALLVPSESLRSDGALDVYETICGALRDEQRPTMADLVRQPSYGSAKNRIADLFSRSISCRFGYSLGVDRYAWQIRSAWKRRLVSEAAEDLRTAVFDPSASTAEILAATKAIADAAAGVEDSGRLDTLTDAIHEWAKMDATPVVPTGFQPVDVLCGGGLPVGGLFVVAAPPSVGKSALALQLVLGALLHDSTMNAVWCMGEMTKEALARRAICHWSTKGTLHPVTMSAADQRTELARGAAINMAMSISDRLSIVSSPLTIQKIEQAVIEKRATLVVIDYVQLVELEGAQDRRAEIDGIVKRVRRLSIEHGVATVCVSNISKMVSGETRIGAIGKESSELDFAADILLLGVPDESEDQNGLRMVRWACKKNRHGPCEDIIAIFDGRLQTFTMPLASRETAFDDWGRVT
jgi:replicative DNA helicase